MLCLRLLYIIVPLLNNVTVHLLSYTSEFYMHVKNMKFKYVQESVELAGICLMTMLSLLQ